MSTFQHALLGLFNKAGGDVTAGSDTLHHVIRHHVSQNGGGYQVVLVN